MRASRRVSVLEDPSPRIGRRGATESQIARNVPGRLTIIEALHDEALFGAAFSDRTS
jgi:hypothetical protein